MEMTKAEQAAAAAAAAASEARAAHGQELKGAEILVRCLQEEHVEAIWGYPGGAVLHIYDALYKQKSIKHVLVPAALASPMP
jgi:acetolactate synthase I/II/III large subunit